MPISFERTVSFDKVRPFVVTVEPQPGESLLGLISRTIANSAVPRLKLGLQLAGFSRPRPEWLAATVVSSQEIQGLARLIGVSLEEVAMRLHTPSAGYSSGAPMVSYFGETIRYGRINLSARRVSPTALCANPYHRAIWHIRGLDFDPETLEPLLASCPACCRRLGWAQASGICFCDKCVDDAGRPNVDLRDFKQASIEVDDLDAVRTMTNLVSHDSSVRERSRGLFSEIWSDLGNAQLFDVILKISEILSDDRTNIMLEGSQSREEFNAVQLSKVARAFIKGRTGLDVLLDEARSINSTQKGHFGNVVTLGRLAKLNVYPLIPSQVLKEFSAAKARHLSRHPNPRKIDWSIAAPEGFVSFTSFAKSQNVSRRSARAWLEDCGIDAIRGGHKGSGLYYREYDIPPDFDDTLSSVTAARILGISRKGLEPLISRGLLAHSALAVLTQRNAPTYSRKSANALLEGLLAYPMASNENDGHSMSEALVQMGLDPLDREDALIYAAKGSAPLLRRPIPTGDWFADLLVCDMRSFHAAMRTILEENEVGAFSEMVTGPEAARIIGLSTDTKLPDLVRSGFLSRRSRGSRVYVRAECVDFRKRYVLAKEIKECIKLPPRRKLTPGLVNLQPIVSVKNVGRVFLRADFQQWLQNSPYSTTNAVVSVACRN